MDIDVISFETEKGTAKTKIGTGAVFRFEKKTGKSFSEAFSENSNPGMIDLVTLTWAGLRGDKFESPEELADNITFDAVEKITEEIIDTMEPENPIDVEKVGGTK